MLKIELKAVESVDDVGCTELSDALELSAKLLVACSISSSRLSFVWMMYV